MPVSDFLLSLALALNPNAGHPLTLNADAVAQPDGAVLIRASTTPPAKTTSIPFKVEGEATIKGAAAQKCASGEHYIKYWRGAEATHKVQASKCAPIKYFPKTDYLQSGKVFPK